MNTPTDWKRDTAAPVPGLPAGEDATARNMRVRRSRKRWLRAGVTALFAACVLALVVGFFEFAERVARAAPPIDPRADAIVVLTGGSARIDGALKLLDEGRASRLLISGVNPDVSSDDLAHVVGDNMRASLDCCIDLGRDAADTIGNAAETRRWAKAQGFSSLIVVTSDYHMPRSMSELASAMPDVDLTPFPVSNPELHFADWWHDPRTFVLLVREYGKYLFARARHALPSQASPGTSGEISRDREIR